MIKYWTKAFQGRELPEVNNHEMKSSREKNKPLTEESAKYTYNNNDDEEQRASDDQQNSDDSSNESIIPP